MAAESERPFTALLVAGRKLPGVEEGVACAGTKLESRTLKVRGKAFAFFKPASLMFKLGESLAEARALAAESPEQWRAGAGGWVEVKATGARLPLARLRRWLAESHALFANTTSGAGRPAKQTKKPARTAEAPKPRPAARAGQRRRS